MMDEVPGTSREAERRGLFMHSQRLYGGCSHQFKVTPMDAMGVNPSMGTFKAALLIVP